MMPDTIAKTRDFLALHIKNVDLPEDADIFATGFVNSLFAMQLILFVEREFGVTIEDEDLDIENFRSIRAIAELVERKSPAAP